MSELPWYLEHDNSYVEITDYLVSYTARQASFSQLSASRAVELSLAVPEADMAAVIAHMAGAAYGGMSDTPFLTYYPNGRAQAGYVLPLERLELSIERSAETEPGGLVRATVSASAPALAASTQVYSTQAILYADTYLTPPRFLHFEGTSLSVTGWAVAEYKAFSTPNATGTSINQPIYVSWSPNDTGYQEVDVLVRVVASQTTYPNAITMSVAGLPARVETFTSTSDDDRFVYLGRLNSAEHVGQLYITISAQYAVTLAEYIFAVPGKWVCGYPSAGVTETVVSSLRSSVMYAAAVEGDTFIADRINGIRASGFDTIAWYAASAVI